MTYAATITEKGQVTIPVAIRNILGLEPSSRLIFSIEEEKIIVQPIKNDIFSLYGSIKNNSSQSLNLKSVRKTVLKKIARNIAKEGL